MTSMTAKTSVLLTTSRSFCVFKTQSVCDPSLFVVRPDTPSGKDFATAAATVGRFEATPAVARAELPMQSATENAEPRAHKGARECAIRERVL